VTEISWIFAVAHIAARAQSYTKTYLRSENSKSLI